MSATATKLHHLKLFFSNQYCRAQILRTTDNHIVADACTWEPALKKALRSTADKARTYCSSALEGHVTNDLA
jgi:ribosomal protein L18